MTCPDESFYMTQIDVYGFLYSYKAFSEEPSSGAETCSSINEPNLAFSLGDTLEGVQNAPGGGRRMLNASSSPTAAASTATNASTSSTSSAP